MNCSLFFMQKGTKSLNYFKVRQKWQKIARREVVMFFRHSYFLGGSQIHSARLLRALSAAIERKFSIQSINFDVFWHTKRFKKVLEFQWVEVRPQRGSRKHGTENAELHTKVHLFQFFLARLIRKIFPHMPLCGIERASFQELFCEIPRSGKYFIVPKRQI